MTYQELIGKDGSAVRIEYGTECRAYKNLNNGKVSVQTKIKGKGWIVAGYCEALALCSVTFPVSEARRQAVIRTKQREVHAWAQGFLVQMCCAADCETRVTYNPYVAGHFFAKDFEDRPEIKSAPVCKVQNGFAWIAGVRK